MTPRPVAAAAATTALRHPAGRTLAANLLIMTLLRLRVPRAATPAAGRRKDHRLLWERRHGTGGLKNRSQRIRTSLLAGRRSRERLTAVNVWKTRPLGSSSSRVMLLRSGARLASSGLYLRSAQRVRATLVLEGGIGNRAWLLIRCRKACRFEPCSRSHLFMLSSSSGPGSRILPPGSRVRIPPAAPFFLSPNGGGNVRQLPSLIPVSRTTRAHLS